MALAGYHTLRHASREPITEHDHLIHQHISNNVLAIPHHNMPCKNKLDILYFVVIFMWLLGQIIRTVLIYAKTQR